MARAGFEPARPFGQGILSPQRLPVPPPSRIAVIKSDALIIGMQADAKADPSPRLGAKGSEKLAEAGMVDDFFEAIDADDFKKASSLMKLANIDRETISMVLKKMADADGRH